MRIKERLTGMVGDVALVAVVAGMYAWLALGVLLMYGPRCKKRI